MFDIAVAALSKILDVIAKRADLRRDQIGPLKFYELYLSLRDVLAHAHEISMELSDAINEDRHIPHIARAMGSQSKSLQEFVIKLWELIHYVRIFDDSLGRELSAVAGVKFVLLTSYYELFSKIDGNELLLREWDRSETVEKLVEVTGSSHDLDFEALAGCSSLTARRYDFTDPEDLRVLSQQAAASVEGLEAACDSLGAFIRANCTLNDLFPREIMFRGSHRR